MNDGDEIRELVRQRIQALGLEKKALSRELGRNHAYIHQYLNKRSPVFIGEQERPLLAMRLGIPEDALKPPPRGSAGPKPRAPARPKALRSGDADAVLIEGLIAAMLQINRTLKLNWPPERMARVIAVGYQAGMEKDEPNPSDIIDKLVQAFTTH
jgi:hypothetical protein